jgi:Predicted nucleotide-binding protein containing TIR-like domain
MNKARSLPRLFVGSSTEGLDIAYAIQENLEFDAETTVWSQGFFTPSGNALSELIEALILFDFAAFVFSPDDTVRIRGRDHQAIRDNVVFELGLFFGGLGQRRCFFVVPRDQGPMHLPTDLLGTIPLTYSSRRSDGNLVAALGAACNKIRRAFRAELTAIHHAVSASVGYAQMSFQDYVDVWNGPELSQSRRNIREIAFDPYSDEFAAQRDDMQRVFAFLDGLSDAVLDHAIDEQQARTAFQQAVVSFWPVAASMLAPPNHQDEWWDPPPRIAELYGRWK